jgi:AraC-like DNA-binding protein
VRSPGGPLTRSSRLGDGTREIHSTNLVVGRRYERSTTVSALLLRPIVAALQKLGIEAEPVLEGVGIDSSLLVEDEERLPVQLMSRLWDRAVLVSGREDFGLLAASGVEPNALHVIGYLAASSATVGEALARVRRFTNLLTNGVQLRLEEREPEARLVFVSLPVSRVIADFRVALFVRASRQVLRELTPHRVDLRHPRPAYSVRYSEALSVAPNFSSSEDAVVFSSAVLALPMPAADAVLCRILERQAEGTLRGIGMGDDFLLRVRQVMTEELGRRRPTSGRVAKRLGVHPRTLARYLNDRGATHQSLLDELRYELAQRYLGEYNMTVAETSAKLGFRHPTTLAKAFRRWSGRTPRECVRSQT